MVVVVFPMNIKSFSRNQLSRYKRLASLKALSFYILRVFFMPDDSLK